MSNFFYVYVLVSNPRDSYYEQALISIISLRHHNPDAAVVLLVDDSTRKTLVLNRALIKEYVSEIKCVELPKEMSNREKSRWLKTSMYRFISGDFLFIDNDTVILKSLKNIESMNVDFGCVLDKHLSLSKHCNRDLIISNAKKMAFHPSFEDMHFNSGVMLVRKTRQNEEFFCLWHSLWECCVKKNVYVDQTSLAEANYRLNGLIKKMPDALNCQVEYGMKFLGSAAILHFFVTGDKYDRRPHIFMDPAFYKKIKQEGISEDVMKIILNPFDGFKEKTQIVGNVAVDYYNSYLSRFFFFLFFVLSIKIVKEIF